METLQYEQIVKYMNLGEKINQLSMVHGRDFLQDGEFSRTKADTILKNGSIGAILDPKLPTEQNVKVINDIQSYIIEKSPYDLPAIVVAECLHGYMGVNATIFPQSISMASSWNELLVKEVAEAIALESSSVGINQGLAPDLDLARELRWGRVEETYGEDPYLCERLGIAYINGLQGQKLIDDQHIGATIKHFVAHGSPEGGVNLSPVYTGPRQLRELYLPPFKAAIQEAGVISVMNAYSELDGIPIAASKEIMTDLLRDECGFNGYVIADFGSIDMLQHFHKTAENLQMAGVQALEAGIDMEAPFQLCYGSRLKEAVEKNILKEDVIDKAVIRVLKTKHQLGLNNYKPKNQKWAMETINCRHHQILAQQAAEESIILLENKNDILPLHKNIKSIAIIGPNADRAQLGDYTIEKATVVTPLEGIKEQVSPYTQVYYSQGCDFYLQEDKIDEAVKIAKKSDVAIIVAGGSSMVNCGIGWEYESLGEKFKESYATCGEGFDRTDLTLPGKQKELIEAVSSTGTPIILVLMNGRPYSIPWAKNKVNALLEVWYPGEKGGTALANILFGKVNPSGKLPLSIPKKTGQLPLYYNHKPSARGFYKEPGSLQKPGRDYVFCDTKPLYPFGYGISYTHYSYSNLNAKVNESKKIIYIEVSVKNDGARAGKEVVQLYVNDLISSVTTPIKKLIGFNKVFINPKEEVKISFTIPFKRLGLYNKEMKKVTEAGDFEFMVDTLSCSVNIKQNYYYIK
ncbi:glycoside hydrolase family 3 N-terminal domain-containing protein [Vallitalea guaymasensis]|uniref:glycoside hydrolase family 3 N-terminal domain-containing protein n=1 Tax=Vallitalea guaymasensis TaxID=1185412 RepID=UPI00272D8DF6|nr:glycoside hydrolase family 3 N-terminal domain-containing protein [Vallitalea guaymasensis]